MSDRGRPLRSHARADPCAAGASSSTCAPVAGTQALPRRTPSFAPSSPQVFEYRPYQNLSQTCGFVDEHTACSDLASGTPFTTGNSTYTYNHAVHRSHPCQDYWGCEPAHDDKWRALRPAGAPVVTAPATPAPPFSPPRPPDRVHARLHLPVLQHVRQPAAAAPVQRIVLRFLREQRRVHEMSAAASTAEAMLLCRVGPQQC